MMLPLMGNKGCDGTTKKYDYDVAAIDWCYFQSEGDSEIKFYGIVKNVGTKPISGPGQYEIGASAGGAITYKKFKLSPAPYWEVAPGKTYRLDNTIALPYHPDNKYDFSFTVFDLKKDQKMANNIFKGFAGATMESIKNSGKECKAPGE